MPDQPSPYRRTLFDRHGPAAVDLVRSATYGLMVFGITLGAVLLAARRMSLAVVLIALLAAVGTATASLWLARAAGSVAKTVTAGAGSTPYEEQYSYQQALVMQGKVDAALASFEEIIAAKPAAAQPRIRAAELYVQHKADSRRAAKLLREALRSSELTSGEDVYATNRLVDLLAGPLGDPGRACVELRKLIERYPGSTTAARARDALSRIKETLRPY